eukprot:2153019-Rhodomonas_salina.1
MRNAKIAGFCFHLLHEQYACTVCDQIASKLLANPKTHNHSRSRPDEPQHSRWQQQESALCLRRRRQFTTLVGPLTRNRPSSSRHVCCFVRLTWRIVRRGTTPSPSALAPDPLPPVPVLVQWILGPSAIRTALAIFDCSGRQQLDAAACG